VIRVLIVDDHQVVRQGLRFVLEQEDGIEVVGECADGTRALAVIPALRPDVVLLDLLMPDTSGLEVLQRIGRGETRPAFVVLTSFQEDEQVIEALRAGAVSYLPKTAAVGLVVDAVREAAQGRSVLEPGVAAMLVRKVREGPERAALDVLSPREREVLAGLARGRSNREIARALSVSEETVRSHVKSILAKVGLADRTQAAIFGLQHGVVPLDQALEE